MMNESLLAPKHDANVNPSLEFRDGQCLLKMVTQAGTKLERFVSWASVREAATKIPVDSGWLAPEIVRWGTGRRGDWVVAFIPPGRHTLELTAGTPGESETVERVTAPLPGLVLFGICNRYYIWSVKTARLEPYHEVYRCPLPNVMQDASICWGLVKPPQAGPRSILKAFELFIGSTFNNHAANGKSKKHREDVRELLKELASDPESTYPVEDLQRQVAQIGVTLDTAIRQFWESEAMPG